MNTRERIDSKIPIYITIPNQNFTCDMTTKSGVQVRFDDLENLEVRVEDIRFASENICRYCGHANWRLIKHHALVTELAIEYFIRGRIKDPKTPGYASIHDFHEVYVTDVPHGLKKYIPDYCAIEHRAETRIHKVLGLDILKKNTEEVDFIDRRALVTEMALLGHPGYWANALKYGGRMEDFEEEIFYIVRDESTDKNWSRVMEIYNKTLELVKKENNNGN